MPDILSLKQLEDAAKRAQGKLGCGECSRDENGNCFETVIETALAYRDMLKRLEFMYYAQKGNSIIKICPVCKCQEHRRHEPGCKLAALLKKED
jgi:hypothetical protein